MTIAAFLAESTMTLKNAGIESAHLDCLILLEDALDLDRSIILAYTETEIDDADLDVLRKKITQRGTHIPLAYIRGRASFYGREFRVNEHVLVPRPETEIMIELLKTLELKPNLTLVDVGTGSGCIGITAALELHGAKVHLSDVDPLALAVARDNAESLAAHVSFEASDLLYNAPHDAHVVLANLPYVPTTLAINKSAEYEPMLALFAGEDGLDTYRRLWEQLSTRSSKPHIILTEALPEQHQANKTLAHDAGYRLLRAEGFIQQFNRL